jgi:curved DNA-binding protein CbpA
MLKMSKDYYNVLGVARSSSTDEIKAVFRKLAMRYHPDRNPEDGGAMFRLIHEAYETLSDPTKRSSYDSKLVFNTIYSTPKTTTKRRSNEGDISAEEWKRRQYYHQQYADYIYTGKSVKPEKSNYKESRYILFAIPLAVALLMFIVNIYSYKMESGIGSKSSVNVNGPVSNKADMMVFEANTSEPYLGWFGANRFDTSATSEITLLNQSQKDLVVCFTNKKTNQVDAHFLISKGSSVTLNRLLKGEYYIKYNAGLNFSKASRNLSKEEVSGGFLNKNEFAGNPKQIVQIKGENEGNTQIVVDENTLNSCRSSADAFFSERESRY